MLTNINQIKHGFYINLETRPDRKAHVEQQLTNIGLHEVVQRFNAIKLPNGALGCSMSHLKCVEKAKEMNWDHVFIVEDDILFLNPSLFQQQVNTFLERKQNNFDVLLLAGNNMPPYNKVDECCVQVFKCQTTTGYLVMSHYYDTLITNFREGITNLVKEPMKHSLYAIDKYWFHLQKKDKWFLIIPLTVVQREDYSDIEKRQTNYRRCMTDLNKEALFRNKIHFSS